jgi:tetratricopeptide (TPR) repeat protein
MTRQSKENLSRLYSSRDTIQHFLLKRSKKGESSREAKDLAPSVSPGSSQSSFHELAGNEFIQQAMDFLENAPFFGAMVIKPDTVNPTSMAVDADDAQALIFEIKKVADRLLDQSNGCWGLLETDVIGCFLSGADDVRCLELAGHIQKDIVRRTNRTVSIGAAVFPTIDYGRRDIMDNARKALSHAAFLGPDQTVLFDSVSLNISGDAYYQDEDVDGAVREFQAALKLDPENANVHNSLGVCYGVQGSLEKALDAFKTVIDLDDDHFMAHYNAGYVYSLQNNTQKAMEHFLKADAIGEDVFEVTFQIGKLYLDMCDPSKGKPFLKKALTIRPDSAITHFHLGECCQALDKREQAVVHYETAVKKNPNDAAALSVLGALYDEKGENPEISTMFCEKSVEMSPENGLFQYRLGCVYANNDQLDNALNVFENAIKLGYDAEKEMERVKERLNPARHEGLSN